MLGRKHAWASLALSSIAVAACAPRQVVPLVSTSGAPVTMTPASTIPLEIVTRSSAVPEPLPVAGARAAYAEVETALGTAVATGTAPWADAHRAAGVAGGGWELLVEMTQAELRHDGERLVVGLVARVTLRARKSGRFVAQAQVRCDEAGLVAADAGAPVLYACMTRLGRDVGGWLGRVVP